MAGEVAEDGSKGRPQPILDLEQRDADFVFELVCFIVFNVV